MVIRVCFSALLLWSVLFLPFWFSFALALIGMACFRFYLEGIIMLLVSDLVFGTRESRFLNITFLSTILATLFFIGMEFLKKKIRII